MDPLIAKLQGTDRRSIGRSEEVVDQVLADPGQFRLASTPCSCRIRWCAWAPRTPSRSSPAAVRTCCEGWRPPA
jgi:hypothetical protein